MFRKKSAQSAAPKKAGRFAQVRQVFTATRGADPLVGWWMALASLGTLLAMVAIGALVKHWVYFLFLGLPLAALAASVVLSIRAKRAAYKSIEGKPGAAGAALSSLRKGWYFEQQPVAAEAGRAGDMSSTAMVFRATGRPGVVLVVEGPAARATKLAEAVAGQWLPKNVVVDRLQDIATAHDFFGRDHSEIEEEIGRCVASIPAPISPTASFEISTDASVTRWITARIVSRLYQ